MPQFYVQQFVLFKRSTISRNTKHMKHGVQTHAGSRRSFCICFWACSNHSKLMYRLLQDQKAVCLSHFNPCTSPRRTPGSPSAWHGLHSASSAPKPARSGNPGGLVVRSVRFLIGSKPKLSKREACQCDDVHNNVCCISYVHIEYNYHTT